MLAGDHCKAASDLHVPLVGVGLFYRNGYFDQRAQVFNLVCAVSHLTTHFIDDECDRFTGSSASS